MIRRSLSAIQLSALLAISFTVPLPAQVSPSTGTGVPPEIKAKELNVDLNTNEMIYTGHARATYGDTVFLADEIRWHRPSNVATATGHAMLQRGELRLLADSLTYRIDEESFTVEEVRLGREPFYFSGTLLNGDRDILVVEDATLSFGEPGFWTPSLHAKTLSYEPETDRVKATGGRLGLGGLPLLPVPAVYLPLTGTDLFEITVDGGASSRLGLFGRIGATVPVAEHWRLGADLGIYTNRGVMAGPAFGYDWVNEDGTGTWGRFTSGYIRDSGDRGDLGFDILGDVIGADRGHMSWSHRQRLSDRLTLNADFNYWSDSEVIRDFRSDEFFPVQVPDSFAELNYTTANTVSGLFVRAQPNDFHEIRQRLPELTWELLPSPWTHGIIQQAQSSLAVLRRDPAGPGTAIDAERFDAYYALTRPWSPQSWLTFNPVIGARLTHYTETMGNQDDYTRTLGEFGIDAEMRFSGTFDYQNTLWKIDGLRHLITPRVSYRYIPDADKGQSLIPQIDRRVFATYLEPLGLGGRRQIDDLSRTHTLRLAVDQRLQTRDDTYGSRDLVQLNVALDSRFDQPIGARTLSALHTEVRLSPAPFLDVDVYHRASPGDWTLRELNTAITLHSAEQWQLQFANHYLENDIQEFIGAFAYRFNEVWEGYTRHHFDSRRSRFVEQTYGVRQTIANRWQVGYELSFFEGARRESDFGFAMRFDVISF